MVSSVALPIKIFSVSDAISGVLTYFHFKMTGRSEKTKAKKKHSPCLLGAFRIKLRKKATIIFITPVCLSVRRKEQHAPH